MSTELPHFTTETNDWRLREEFDARTAASEQRIIQRERFATLDDQYPEPEPVYVCPFGNVKSCQPGNYCRTCRVSFNLPFDDAELAEIAAARVHQEAYDALMNRLRNESPASLVADKPFWESLTGNQKAFVMKRITSPMCVPCWPLLAPAEYVWLQKQANKTGGGNQDELLLAEWALAGLKAAMDSEAAEQRLQDAAAENLPF